MRRVRSAISRRGFRAAVVREARGTGARAGRHATTGWGRPVTMEWARRAMVSVRSRAAAAATDVRLALIADSPDIRGAVEIAVPRPT